MKLVPLALTLLAACATNAARKERLDASRGVANAELAALCADAWEARLEDDPIGATYLGDARHSGELPDLSPAGEAKRIARVRSFAERAERIDPSTLPEQDAITRSMLLADWRAQIDVAACGVDPRSWQIDATSGPQIVFATLAGEQPVATADDRARFVARWRAMPRFIDQACENLRRGIANGRVASRHAVLAAWKELDALLAKPLEEDPLLAPALGGGRFVRLDPGTSLARIARENGVGDRDLALVNRFLLEGARGRPTSILVPSKDDRLDLHERARFLADVYGTVRDGIRPAFERYRAVIANEVAPRARSDEQPGLASIANGADFYRVLVRRETSLELTPEAIHAIGLEEIARIRVETEALGKQVFGIDVFAAIQEKLRGERDMHFASADEIRATAERTLRRAEAALPGNFGILPRAPCRVVEIPAHEAPYSTIAYYREPPAPGTVPDVDRFGRYFVNVSAPTTRPRYEAEALAFHESVPGHHLQIAIAQELDALPLVRRHAGCTAFVEGWALYAERLADELGLYSSPSDRFGMLSYDAWRAARLVVDTGLHALGWSRERAIEYMEANTLLAKNNVENEVDRYVATPGQALAYKLGQREILALRREAKEALGERFRLAEFHDRVLENGAVDLATLRARIGAWIASAKAAP